MLAVLHVRVRVGVFCILLLAGTGTNVSGPGTDTLLISEIGIVRDLPDIKTLGYGEGAACVLYR